MKAAEGNAATAPQHQANKLQDGALLPLSFTARNPLIHTDPEPS